MHWDLNSILGIVITIGLGLLHQAIKTPKDHERAALLTRLADDAAAVCLSVAPDAPWAQLVAEIVARLKAAGAPTSNDTVLQKAATAALVRVKGLPAAPAGH